MAEGFARHLAGTTSIVASAGSRPSGKVHPRALQLMNEVGIDLSEQRSKGLSGIPTFTWDAVVTMGCDDACPHVPARQHIDWDLPDPKDLSDAEFRRIRDEIGARVADLIATLQQKSRN